MSLSLEALATLHRRARNKADRLYAELLDRVVEEAQAEGANVRAIADRAGIARGTIYNELGRRQERRDELSGNGAPAPAPADVDLTEAQERVTRTIAAGGTFAGGELRGRDRAIVRALRDRGLIAADSLDLTDRGRAAIR